MKNSALWLSLGLLLTSLASVLKFRDEPSGWRYDFSLAAAGIFSLIFLAGVWAVYIKPKKK